MQYTLFRSCTCVIHSCPICTGVIHSCPSCTDVFVPAAFVENNFVWAAHSEPIGVVVTFQIQTSLVQTAISTGLHCFPKESKSLKQHFMKGRFYLRLHAGRQGRIHDIWKGGSYV